MEAAQDWKLTPTEWDALDAIEKAEMMAFTRSKQKMGAYESAKAEDGR